MRTPKFKEYIKVDKNEAEKLKIQAKKKRQVVLKKLTKPAKILLVTVILLSLAFLSAKKFANVSMSNMTDSLKGIFLNSAKGEGFPYDITDNYIQSEAIGSYLAVVGDKRLVYLNANAKEIFSFEHNFISPVFKTKNSRGLFFCEGSTNFIVTSCSEILYDLKATKNLLDSSIVNADIGQKGNIAFVNWSKESSCEINVFNNSLEKIYSYSFSSGRVLDISLSNDGKYMCAALIDAENAKIFTRLLVFSLESPKPLIDYKIKDETAFSIEFLANNNIVLSGLSKLYTFRFLKDSAPKVLIDYFGGSVQNFAYDSLSGRESLAVSEYISASSKIYLINSQRQKYKSFNVNALKSMSRNKKYTLCLTDGGVFCVKNNGKVKFRTDESISADEVVVSGSRFYIFSGNKIYSFGISRWTKVQI